MWLVDNDMFLIDAKLRIIVKQRGKEGKNRGKGKNNFQNFAVSENVGNFAQSIEGMVSWQFRPKIRLLLIAYGISREWRTGI